MLLSLWVLLIKMECFSGLNASLYRYFLCYCWLHWRLAISPSTGNYNAAVAVVTFAVAISVDAAGNWCTEYWCRSCRCGTYACVAVSALLLLLLQLLVLQLLVLLVLLVLVLQLLLGLRRRLFLLLFDDFTGCLMVGDHVCSFWFSGMIFLLPALRQNIK